MFAKNLIAELMKLPPDTEVLALSLKGKWLLNRIYKKLKETTSEPTLGSLFDGIGGFPLCWSGQTAWVAEIDEFCNAVTRHNFRTKE